MISISNMYADLAMLTAEGQTLRVASFGNSDNLHPGETVIAIGSPLGDFKNYGHCGRDFSLCWNFSW